MADFGLLQYLCLKTAITIMRLLAYPFMRPLTKAPSSSTRTLIQIPTRDPTRFIKAYIHLPPGYSTSTPHGVLLNWHGSGFIMPSLGMDHEFCDRIAQEASVVVLDADYRKAPEHPFPAPVEDVEDTLKWVESQPDRFDPRRVAVSGFSAGGNLALVAASELRRHFKGINIRAVYAFYPLVDLARNPALKTVSKPIAPFPVFTLRMFNTCYTPKAELRKDPRVSPTYADPDLFPATTIIFACGADNLSPEAEEMGNKLKAGGANVEVVQLNNAPHGFDKGVRPGSEVFVKREMTYSRVVQSLREGFGG
ncbi:Alpha/Beta hydrolase protein [Dactylonectria macrodidyma]|uniref:Alpha/Beta hydrolase protein n=1 Tax=Dactylonectria macrodidyma TaxID=307937 RepID=A0A9P9FUR3_9HYPO|nr:Alpha/Beta hydrolase protein [Dactylonectria macrodidyma]